MPEQFHWTPLGIVLTVLLFIILVAIHEWGHFSVARRAGVWVKEFAIGFGPKLFSFHRKETMYTFRALPLGGFVRMAGEDDEGDDPPEKQYATKSIAWRAAIIFAGPLMNIVLSLVLFLLYAYGSGIPEQIKIKDTLPNEAAQIAGIQPGDRIVSIDGTPIGTNGNEVSALIQAAPNRAMQWVIERNGQRQSLSVVPKQVTEKGESRVRVGIMMEVQARQPTVVEAVEKTFVTFARSAELIVEGFKKLVFGQLRLDDIGGPVRMAEITVKIASADWISYVWWAALLNLYLAMLNLLPIPSLDGSRLLFLSIEFVRRRPVHPKWENVVHLIGFSLLMMLMVFVTINDIARLFRG